MLITKKTKHYRSNLNDKNLYIHIYFFIKTIRFMMLIEPFRSLSINMIQTSICKYEPPNFNEPFKSPKIPLHTKAYLDIQFSPCHSNTCTHTDKRPVVARIFHFQFLPPEAQTNRTGAVGPMASYRPTSCFPALCSCLYCLSEPLCYARPISSNTLLGDSSSCQWKPNTLQKSGVFRFIYVTCVYDMCDSLWWHQHADKHRGKHGS